MKMILTSLLLLTACGGEDAAPKPFWPHAWEPDLDLGLPCGEKELHKCAGDYLVICEGGHWKLSSDPTLFCPRRLNDGGIQ